MVAVLMSEPDKVQVWLVSSRVSVCAVIGWSQSLPIHDSNGDRRVMVKWPINQRKLLSSMHWSNRLMGNSGRTPPSVGTASKSSDGCVKRFIGSDLNLLDVLFHLPVPCVKI